MVWIHCVNDCSRHWPIFDVGKGIVFSTKRRGHPSMEAWRFARVSPSWGLGIEAPTQDCWCKAGHSFGAIRKSQWKCQFAFMIGNSCGVSRIAWEGCCGLSGVGSTWSSSLEDALGWWWCHNAFHNVGVSYAKVIQRANTHGYILEDVDCGDAVKHLLSALPKFAGICSLRYLTFTILLYFKIFWSFM